MGGLADFFRLWGPYSVAALGAALLGYGLVSGLLLVRRQGRPFARPYFMSAFAMAVIVFVVTTIERAALSDRLAVFKVAVVLVTIGYGVALVQRCWTRSLSSRSVTGYVVISATCTALPWLPAVIGALSHRAELLAATRNLGAVDPLPFVERYSAWMLTPLVAAAIGSGFLAVASLMLLFRRARERS